MTHALPHLATLDGRIVDGRVLRIAWSGRGTAVYLADVVATRVVR